MNKLNLDGSLNENPIYYNQQTIDYLIKSGDLRFVKGKLTENGGRKIVDNNCKAVQDTLGWQDHLNSNPSISQFDQVIYYNKIYQKKRRVVAEKK